jgi:spoIIIJ-associated protein
MEWVETTAKSLEEAKELALDRLGVAADEAEFEILEEPRAGLFGRVRGEARVRARVMPTAVRPKQDRRGRGRSQREGRGKNGKDRPRSQDRTSDESVASAPESTTAQTEADDAAETSNDRPTASTRDSSRNRRSKQQKEQQVNADDEVTQVSPVEVGEAAKAFMSGLVDAFGATAETTVEIDGSEIDVRVTGSELGLMVGHGGRTLMAVQDLVRVASQRRLGDHDTRLRIDVGGYREKRTEALGRFAVAVAHEVLESGVPKALEPMQSADRKVVHDALASVEGVTSRSEGDDPMRRVVIAPA